MEILKYLFDITALLALNMLVANRLSWLLTEWKRPIAAFKPFSCRPCLSFWLTILQGVPLVLAIADEWQGYRSGTVIMYLLSATVALMAYLNYLLIKNKIIIHD